MQCSLFVDMDFSLRFIGVKSKIKIPILPDGAYVRAFEANQSHNNIVVNQDETVELLCDAVGDPEPVVRVMNNTRGNERILVEIKGRKAKYHIQHAKCEYDTGNYTCSAKNRYNEGRQLFALLVYCKCILLNKIVVY